MLRRSIDLFRVLMNTQGWILLLLFLLQGGFAFYLKFGHWDRLSSLFFRDLCILGTVFNAWLLAGYLGFIFNSTFGANWIRQLPFTETELSFVPQCLMMSFAIFVYLFSQGIWNIGTDAQALPGTYIFLFGPFLTFYLVRRSRNPGLSLVLGGVLSVALYIAIFLFLVKFLRNDWYAIQWTPFQQIVFIFASFLLALAFERRNWRFAVPLVVAFMCFAGIFIICPPSHQSVLDMLFKAEQVR